MTTLKKLKVAIPAATPENDKPTVHIEADLVEQYNEASRVQKDAEKLMVTLAPKLKQSALDHLYAYNIAHPTAPLTTVVLQDEEGARANVSFKNAYGKEVDEVKALDALEEVGCEDPNLYLAETLRVAFDGSTFCDPLTGDVRLVYFKAMQAAMETVSAKFGHPNPLSTTKVVAVRPTFHEARFALWPTTKAQATLSVAIPNQVSLTPVKD